MLTQRHQQGQQVIVLIGQRAVRLLCQPMHLAQQQLVLLHFGVTQLEAPHTFHTNTQQAVVLLDKITDQRLAPDRCNHRRRLADLLAFDDAHYTKTCALLHAAANHVQVAGFEYLQIQQATGKQHSIEGKQR
ncbi:hypothetical protein D3C73_1294980 [compost metagenome]